MVYPVVAADDIDWYNCRVGKLVDMLLDGKSYQLRTEAAYALKSFPCAEAQEALLTALQDDHEAVRIAALSSLAEMGDKTIIPVLRAKKERNHVVREQLHRTVILLEERFPQLRAPVDWKRIRGVFEIGSLTDKTGGPGNYTRALRHYLARHLRLKRDLTVAEPPHGLAGLHKQLKRGRIKPLVITGILKSLVKRRLGGEVIWEAAISITVLDYPGKSIRAVLSNRASVSSPTRHYRPQRDASMKDRAVEEVMRAVSNDLANKLKDL